MPVLYAHLRFGEEVGKRLPTPYTDIIAQYPEAFALGTQGPDILCYHYPIKTTEIRKKAPYLHSISGNQFFLTQGKKLLQGAHGDLLQDNGAFAAYLCGVLCHFTLDATCHFYIDETMNEALTHGKMESELDKCVLRRDGKPIRGYNTATPIVDKNGAREAAAKVLEVPEEIIARAIKTMRKYNSWFSKKCEAFHGFVHFILKIIGKERQFGDMFLHKKDDPLCAETNKVLMEKWQNAIPQAVTLIDNYFTHLPEWVENQKLDMELFRYDFSGIIKTED